MYGLWRDRNSPLLLKTNEVTPSSNNTNTMKNPRDELHPDALHIRPLHLAQIHLPECPRHTQCWSQTFASGTGFNPRQKNGRWRTYANSNSESCSKIFQKAVPIDAVCSQVGAELLSFLVASSPFFPDFSPQSHLFAISRKLSVRLLPNLTCGFM